MPALDYFPLPVPREPQVEALAFTEDALAKGYQDIIIEAPTGFGKTAVGATLCRWLSGPTNDPLLQPGGYMLVVQKALQDQIATDLGRFGVGGFSAQLIKSAIEYPCPRFKFCGLAVKPCPMKKAGECAYKIQKDLFLNSILGVTNYAYFLTDAAYVKSMYPRAVLVLDECFPSTVVIDTTPINLLHVGDALHSFNHITKNVELSTITKVFRSQPKALCRLVFSDKSCIICTPNHPFFSDDTYIPAKNTEGRYVHRRTHRLPLRGLSEIRLPCGSQAGLSKQTRHKVGLFLLLGRMLQNSQEIEPRAGTNKLQALFKASYLRVRKSTLVVARTLQVSRLRLLFREMLPSQVAFSVVGNHDAHPVTGFQENLKTHAAEQPGTSTRRHREDKNFNERKEIGPASGQWVGSNEMANGTVREVKDPWTESEDGTRGWHGRFSARRAANERSNPSLRNNAPSEMLSYGHWTCGVQVSDRGGREQPQNPSTEDEGLLEDSTFERIRVDRVEILEQSGDGTFGGLCPDGFVYNIEVEGNHNYFANGVLVHNCHNLEKTLTSLVGIELSYEKLYKRDRSLADEMMSLNTSIHDFIFWLGATFLPESYERLKVLIEMAEDVGSSDADAREIFEAKQEYERVSIAYKRLQADPGGWVYWHDVNERTKNLTILCKPIDVGPFFHDYFDAFPRRIYMSAFIGRKSVFCHEMGLHPDSVAHYKAPSDFAKERRPIHLLNAGSLAKQSRDVMLPRMMGLITKIVQNHTDRGVIHTHSYAFADEVVHGLIQAGFAGRIAYPENVDARDEAMKRHAETPGSILISPSLFEGFDFAYDLCRWQIVLKCQYPSLGDQVVKARMARDPEWYHMEAVKCFVQTCGRGMRAKDDTCVTYAIDSDISRLIHSTKRDLPSWFLEAIDDR